MATRRRDDFEEVELANVQKAKLPAAPKVPKERELITGDPGTVKAGLSWFRDGELTAAALLDHPRDRTISLRVAALGAMADEWIAREASVCRERPLGIIEFPVIYTKGPMAGLGKGHTRSVLWVAAAAGAIMTGMSRHVRDIKVIEPNEIKHQMEKLAHNEMCRDTLTEKEKKALGNLIKDNNVMDAIGVGLKHLYRII